MLTPLEMARNTRRAAEMFHRWRQGDAADLGVLVAEAQEEGEYLINVVCGLLYVGTELIKAAADGKTDEYLEQLRGASLIAEAMSGDSDG